MAAAVFFHAHPDDEAIATGGVMMQAAARGHRVVLVCATDGAHGEAEPGTVPDGSTLAEVRAAELHAAAEVLGAHRVEWLGYGDSGMEDEPTNHHPDSFWQADLEEAAQRLAAILRDEDARLLTVYDDHGNYGHPDHIQVHRVGVRAAELAGVPHVFEATMNRDRMQDSVHEDFPEGDDDEEIAARHEQMSRIGTPAAALTHAVDVTAEIDRKRRAMAAHRSQIGPESWFLQMPDEAFLVAFGTEWFVERGAARRGEPYLDDILVPLSG